MKKKTIHSSGKKKNNNEGHRKRLRDRFLQSGLDGFLDYEIIELLLTLGTPRKDCKQTAKVAIKTFKGLRGVLDASLEDLQTIKGIGSSNAFGIKLFQAISERYAKEKLPSKITLNSTKKVVDYLKQKFGREKKEHFIVLLLDSQNNLLGINDISTGTFNASIVDPREIFVSAMRYNTAKIILVHNHPSGNTQPSTDDIKITRELVTAGKLLNIEIVDHLIIGNGYRSIL